LRDLTPIAVRFELWEEDAARAWSWQEDAAAGSDAAAPRPADCIFAGTEPALRQLLLQPDSFWTLCYGGELQPRGDMSKALRLVDRLPFNA
jgi:hypothetical protein